MKRALAIFVMVLTLIGPALGVNPGEVLADPALEARARDISKELRCLVCQNETIDESNADLARDLRLLVRERLTAGDSDAQVRQYLVDRYGEFVLLKPRFNAHTWFLWLATPAVFLIGLAVLLRYVKKPPVASSGSPLTEAEKRALDDLRNGNS